jgi:hypothetical protein
MNNSKGFNIKEYSEHVEGLRNQNDLAKRFSEENFVKYKSLLSAFKLSTKSKNNSKGKELESLVYHIFNSLDIFEVKKNVYTSTNEIDILVELSDLGRMLVSFNQIDIKADHILCECKNYDRKVGVTWLGKFCNLLEEQPARIGILFSDKGFAGKGHWDSSKGLVKKFFYRKEQWAEKMYVIDFNMSDFDEIENGISFMDILDYKIRALETDTDYNKLLTKHPAQK